MSKLQSRLHCCKQKAFLQYKEKIALRQEPYDALVKMLKHWRHQHNCYIRKEKFGKADHEYYNHYLCHYYDSDRMGTRCRKQCPLNDVKQNCRILGSIRSDFFIKLDDVKNCWIKSTRKEIDEVIQLHDLYVQLLEHVKNICIRGEY